MRIQDQKRTPQKHSLSHKKKLFDEALSKDLMCPFADHFSPAMFSTLTPMRKQPEYLLSPSPIKKDLFSQLLGTETKHLSSADQNEDVIEEESMSLSEISSDSDNSMIEEEESLENEGNWSDQNGIKKRKRKSTAQIKLLKQELDGEMNWTKQKICKMAEITGLSQSQVYKWCWDQKKKQNKGAIYENERNITDRRKMIKKNLVYRGRFSREDEEQCEQKQNHKEIFSRRTMTKLKAATGITDTHDTEKKVNKRLVFF